MRSRALPLWLAVVSIVATPLIARAPSRTSTSPLVSADLDPSSSSSSRHTPGSPAVRESRVRPASLTLWAWERPEDLRFLRATPVAVAPLIATLALTDEAVRVDRRRQSIELPEGIEVTMVVRIEMDAARPPLLTARQHERLVETIAELARLSPPTTLQIDFDAPRSARLFYRHLLADLRASLPERTRLSMTALASWCLGDSWLENLPVDEVVPMAFRMGGDTRAVRQHFAAGHDFQPACRSAIGIATDEPWPDLPAGRRLYAFSTRPWTPALVRSLLRPPAADADGGAHARTGAGRSRGWLR